MTTHRVTAERLRTLLHYDPLTGHFTWRVTRTFTALAGTRAGRYRKHDNRFEIKVDGVSRMAAILAWLYMTGEWPKHEIDHIDTDPTNDRWTNLRDVPHSLNAQNHRRAFRNNGTGMLGVCFDKKTGKFQAGIKVRGQAHYLGQYATAAEAHEAYKAAKRVIHPGNTL